MITLQAPLLSLPTPIIALLVFLLLSCITTVWLSLTRLQGKSVMHKGLVTSFNVLAFASVSAWLIGFNISHEKVVSAVLLTEGASESRDIKPSQGKAFELRAPSDNSEFFPDASQIGSIMELHNKLPDLQSLHVIGNGLSQKQWAVFDQLYQGAETLNIAYTPGKLETGMVNLVWQQQLKVGQFQLVSGLLQAQSPQSLYTISLFDPTDRVIETVNLRAGEPFSFSFVPKGVGEWRYPIRVQERGAEEIIADESVAFAVGYSSKPRILVNQSAPLFETRHLKNWATEHGVRMTITSKISRSKSISQHLNYSSENQHLIKDPLAQGKLGLYDFMVIDGRAFMALSEDAKRYLNIAVNEGLGLLILADADLMEAVRSKKMPTTAGFNLRLSNQKIDRIAVPIWPNSIIQQPIKVFNANFSEQDSAPLITDENGRALVMSKGVGLGKLALSLMPNTYQWKTAGMAQTYSHYWQFMLSRLGRNNNKQQWQHTDKVAYPLDQQQLCFRGVNPVEGQLIHTSTKQIQNLTFTPQWLEQDKYCAAYWGLTSGWYQINPNDSELPGFRQYIYPASNWKAWQQQDKMTATKAKVGNLDLEPVVIERPVATIWYWLVLILSLTCLWIERRFFS